MRRLALATLMIACVGVLTVAVAAQASGSHASNSHVSKTIVATAIDKTPQSRAQGTQAIDDAVAAALIGAIVEQFDQRSVKVKLDRVDSTPASFAQRDVRGSGRLMIGDDEAWIPFQFTALYDTTDASAGYPALTLGSAAGGEVLSIEAGISRQLASEVGGRLDREFAQQHVRLAIDQVRVTHVGSRFLKLDANGTVDFGSEGTTDAGVQALYDPRNGQWLQLQYELGATANREPAIATTAAIATR